MPRPRYIDRPDKRTISLRQSTTVAVDFALLDPLTGKPGHGQWSELVDTLLKLWLDDKITIHIKPRKASLKDFL